jgi:hypothetical protein
MKRVPSIWSRCSAAALAARPTGWGAEFMETISRRHQAQSRCSPPAAIRRFNFRVWRAGQRSFISGCKVPTANGDENRQRPFTFGTKHAKVVTGEAFRVNDPSLFGVAPLPFRHKRKTGRRESPLIYD